MPLPREVFEKILFYRQEVDRIWNEYLRPGRSESFASVGAPVDIYETEESVKIDVELPGVDAGSIDVSVSTDVLVIEGTRAAPELVGWQYHQAERSYGKFQRIVEIPRPVNMGKMTARLGGGILKITIPKVADRRGQWRRIEVLPELETTEVQR